MEKIRNIINEWNPIQIYPLLIDEYDLETKEIFNYISNNGDVTPYELAEFIDSVFVKNFNKNLYQEKIEKLLEIAALILD